MNTSNEFTVAFEQFYPVARRFCSLVESAAMLDKTQFLLRIYRQLPNLIGAATCLPAEECNEVDDENTDADEQTPVDAPTVDVGARHEQWRQLYDSLREKLGDWDLYRQVFNPLKDSATVYGSLSDDIADIYRDLKKGLNPAESQTARPQDAIFEWRLGFYSHWGKHAIDALGTIHWLLKDALS